jgi:hypothetical protein
VYFDVANLPEIAALFSFHVTVHLRIMQRRRKNQLDAANLKFIDVSHTTCFRYHYAYHQEYKKGRQTAYGVSALVVQ